jgi:DNA-binding CsgD family transcriptional regulator
MRDDRMNGVVESSPGWRIALDLLHRLGCGGMVLDSTGNIIARNTRATHLAGDWADRIPADSQGVVSDLMAATDKVGWLRRKRKPPLILRVVEHVSVPNWALLVLIDPGEPVRLDDGVVRKLFGLTTAESNLAVRLARGERVQAIAHARGVGVGTVRTQLRTVFRKTRTKSQASLILLLARMATIQPDASNNLPKL